MAKIAAAVEKVMMTNNVGRRKGNLIGKKTKEWQADEEGKNVGVRSR